MRIAERLTILLAAGFIIAGCSTPGMNVSRSAVPSGTSIVIGQLTGTRHPLPGFFYMNDMMDVSEIEILGFQVVSDDGSDVALLRPDSRSYFAKELSPGTYTIRRHRRDRPDYYAERYIDIITFRIKPGQLVNLGTIMLVLDGPPSEYYYSVTYMDKGEYIYSYHFRRMRGKDSYRMPLERFRVKRPRVYEQFKGNIVQNTDPVTSEPDRSEKILIDSSHDR